MPRFKHLLFVCTNQRDPHDPKGCCATKGSQELLSRLKELVVKHQLKGKVRVTASGCLDYCAKGCTVAAFSESIGETWYTHLKPEDAEKLFEAHVLKGQRLEEYLETKEGKTDGQFKK
jgi:(2Fe-2S) ferredoxin